jgi:hypothetical protein
MFYELIPFVLNVAIILYIIGTQDLRIALGLFVVIVVSCMVQYTLYGRMQPYQDEANELDTKV